MGIHAHSSIPVEKPAVVSLLCTTFLLEHSLYSGRKMEYEKANELLSFLEEKLTSKDGRIAEENSLLLSQFGELLALYVQRHSASSSIPDHKESVPDNQRFNTDATPPRNRYSPPDSIHSARDAGVDTAKGWLGVLPANGQ